MRDRQVFMTTKDFAIKLGIQEQKVRRWLREGFIKGKKISRSWLVPITEIDRLSNEKAIENNESLTKDIEVDVLEDEEPEEDGPRFRLNESSI
jgi:hypothetical protein